MRVSVCATECLCVCVYASKHLFNGSYCVSRDTGPLRETPLWARVKRDIFQVFKFAIRHTSRAAAEGKNGNKEYRSSHYKNMWIVLECGWLCERIECRYFQLCSLSTHNRTWVNCKPLKTVEIAWNQIENMNLKLFENRNRRKSVSRQNIFELFDIAPEQTNWGKCHSHSAVMHIGHWRALHSLTMIVSFISRDASPPQREWILNQITKQFLYIFLFAGKLPMEYSSTRSSHSKSQLWFGKIWNKFPNLSSNRPVCSVTCKAKPIKPAMKFETKIDFPQRSYIHRQYQGRNET